MIVGIDHVVLLVQQLDDAITAARDAGFTVMAGGQHDSGGTQNALIVFEDGCYVELLGFTTASPPADHYFAARWQRGPGLADVALQSTDIDVDVQAICDRGIQLPLPTHLARERPDGIVASWRMSLPQVLHPGSGFPFLIQDVTDRTIRVPVESKFTHHPNGAIGIAGFSFVVSNLVAALQKFGVILDQSPEDSDSRFQATRSVATIPIDSMGRQCIVLIQPAADSAPERHLERFGDGIYSLSLRSRNDDGMQIGAGDLISPPAFGGARIYLQ